MTDQCVHGVSVVGIGHNPCVRCSIEEFEATNQEKDLDRWMRLAAGMAEAMHHSSAGLCTMNDAEHAVTVRYLAALRGEWEHPPERPVVMHLSGEAGTKPPPPPPPDKG